MVTDSRRILTIWRSYFSQLLNVHRVNDVRQTEIHTLVPEPFGDEMAIETLKRHKSPGNGQIPAELIEAGGKTICSKFINLLNLFGITRNCLRSGRS